MSRISNDLDNIGEVAQHGPEDLFIAGMTLVGSFLLILTINWKLAVLTFLVVPVLVCAIAWMFLKNPPILILDEATSALDTETELAIQQSLAELSAGRTTLVIAHRLATIKNADRIVVVTEEGISEQGRHDELIAAGCSGRSSGRSTPRLRLQRTRAAEPK
ncbi:ABC transporter ATP-binding protein [Paenibacillus oralis]|uniref:ABC transporter ATP-binding protein n=1 Tax=Paenibacillus oralis TaxID=2490856 RepID=A0A3P3U751_9BACL|nr:ABC transporter ATP-binding protein [Paenibacillus oralis]